MKTQPIKTTPRPIDSEKFRQLLKDALKTYEKTLRSLAKK